MIRAKFTCYEKKPNGDGFEYRFSPVVGGLTKENDDRVAKSAGAISAGRKKAFAEGRITQWCKGKTKETDERVI